MTRSIQILPVLGLLLGMAPSTLLGAMWLGPIFSMVQTLSRLAERSILASATSTTTSPCLRRPPLRETARVLRPGGALVLSLDTYSGRRYHAKRLHKSWARTRGATTKHPLIFSTPSAERLLRESGFGDTDSLHVPGTKARRTLFIARRR